MLKFSLGLLSTLILQWSSFFIDSYLLQLVVAGVTAGFIVFYIKTEKIVLAAALLAAYLPGLSYYWDEWELITRFSTGEVPTSHNEHVLPLYLPLLKALFEFAGTHYYLLWSLLALVHVLASYFCFQLLLKHFPKELAILGAVFYATHAHHSESTSWFILFGLAVVKLIALSMLLYPKRVLLLGLSFVAPLFSSVGFLIPLQQGVYYLLYQRGRLLTHFPWVVVGMGLAVLFLGGVSAKSEVVSAFSWFDFSKYLLVATEVGSTLRGLGFIPTLGLNYQVISSHLGITERSLFLVLVIFGLTLSLVLCFLVNKRSFIFFKLSSLAWLAPIIFVRTSLKARGALAARYQEPVVISTSFLICELFSRLSKHRAPLLFILLVPQLFMGGTYRFEERQEWKKFSACPTSANVSVLVPNASVDYMLAALEHLGGDRPTFTCMDESRLQAK